MGGGTWDLGTKGAQWEPTSDCVFSEFKPAAVPDTCSKEVREKATTDCGAHTRVSSIVGSVRRRSAVCA